MLKQTSDSIWQSSLLLSARNVVHGYSSRQLGDMRNPEIREKFVRMLRLDPDCVVSAEQIHGTVVHVIRQATSDRKVLNVDGLVHKQNSVQVSLAVRVADCVPILAVDPDARVIGVAHAGWRGTLGGIASHLIAQMKSVGASAQQIFVSIGPHIGACCYRVPKDRAMQFIELFDRDPRVVSEADGMHYLDVGYANMRQLLSSGIPIAHIDAVPCCTSCQVDTFYSYRKDTKEAFGEMAGIIGFSI